MIDFSDPITVLAVFVPIVGGITASAYYINKSILDKKDRQVKVHVEKVKEANDTIRKVRVRYMNKPIELCSVYFKGYQMTWDGMEIPSEYTIFEGGQRNVTIPNDIFTEDGEVVVKSGKKILKRAKFKDLEIGS